MRGASGERAPGEQQELSEIAATSRQREDLKTSRPTCFSPPTAVLRFDRKHAKLGAATNPYIDPAGYKAWVANMEKNLSTMLAEQRKNPPTN